MGEHQTWVDLLLKLDVYRAIYGKLGGAMGRESGTQILPSHFTLNHVIFALLVFAFIAFGGHRFYVSVRKPDGIVPPRKLNLRNVFEIVANAVFNLASQVMGEKNARTYLPFVGALALFILFSNLLALIPGMGVPTSTLNTNLVLGALVFIVYNVAGIREHGLVGHLKHFMGPVIWLAPLMIPIELISHVVRPVSLSMRLLGNMAADHKVVFTIGALVPLLVPVPFLFLGLLVCIVQTLVFCLLTMVYISMAVAHDH
jgi:F-type H+-transporting ATPase subunit a